MPYNDPVKQRAARRKYRLSHLEETNTHNREYMRKVIAENPKKFSERTVKWNQEHPEYRRKWRKENPQAVIAHKLAEKIPTKPKCEKCGLTKRLERHHPDYSKPLMFKTLCCLCHNTVHRLEELEQ